MDARWSTEVLEADPTVYAVVWRGGQIDDQTCTVLYICAVINYVTLINVQPICCVIWMCFLKSGHMYSYVYM